ncbi:carboxypeptidase regulatory-like domain-containing protein [Limibacter armeniacum]|uniref:carboxypeptidase regulatory-like domain-containing protein n=1 Tax=Limibacter armeniacum TaxID=466084 RepID=UPI002FE6A376
MTKIMLYLSCLLMLFGCKGRQAAAQQPDSQGISGKVLWVEGNQMPGQGVELPKAQPVKRDVYIYPLTNIKDVSTVEGMFYGDFEGKPVAVVQSDEEGQFEVKLPVGQYSVLVKEEKGLFANSTDGYGNIQPIEVKEGEVTDLTISINYMATY